MQGGAAVTRGDCAAFTTEAQTHRQLPRLSERGRVLQDLHGTSPGRQVHSCCSVVFFLSDGGKGRGKVEKFVLYSKC